MDSVRFACEHMEYALNQQSIASVLQDREWQSVLQHLMERLLVAPKRQVQVSGIKPDACGLPTKLRRI